MTTSIGERLLTCSKFCGEKNETPTTATNNNYKASPLNTYLNILLGVERVGDYATFFPAPD
eukprot:scaffold355450_cov45-Prasinocladus_malaysianus.AAC.1